MMTRFRAAVISTALGAFGALLLFGCSGPSSTADDYIGNLQVFNYRGCYDLLSQKDKLSTGIDKFLTEVPLAPNVTSDWFKEIVHVMKFQVGAGRTVDGKVIVPITVTQPDLAKWERTIYAQVGSKGDASTAAQNSLNDNTLPTETFKDDVVLIKDPDGSWKLWVNFPEKEKLRKMHADAVELYHKHQYDQAIAAYQTMLTELAKDQATGNDGLKFKWERELKDIETDKAQIAAGQAYIPKLVMKNVALKMSASGVPAIFGTITNTGDKAIDEVHVTVTYTEGKGKREKTVFSEEHVPIATALEFSDFTRPVLPFVPGETRSFGFKLDAPLSVQQKASPDLNITSVTFTQSGAPLPKPPAPTPTAAASPTATATPATAKHKRK